MSPPRLLLVEDEFLIRLTLSEVLSEDGFEVVEAEDANAALARLGEEGGFDAMLTDIQLPGRPPPPSPPRGGGGGPPPPPPPPPPRPDLPIIFMSGRPEASISANPLDTYINKPYSPAAVSATLRRILGGG